MMIHVFDFIPSVLETSRFQMQFTPSHISISPSGNNIAVSKNDSLIVYREPLKILL